MKKWQKWLIRIGHSNFFLWLVRMWLLIRAIDDAPDGQLIPTLRNQLKENADLRRIKKQADKIQKTKNKAAAIAKRANPSQ